MNAKYRPHGLGLNDSNERCVLFFAEGLGAPVRRLIRAILPVDSDQL